MANVTADAAKIMSDCMFFESLGDTTDCGTASMGGGVSSCGSDECSWYEMGTFTYTVEVLSDRAVSGLGKRAEEPEVS